MHTHKGICIILASTLFNMHAYCPMFKLYDCHSIFQHHGLFKAKESRNPFSFGTAEKKLLIVSCYYVTLEILGFLTFTLTQKNSNRLREELQIYFMCESQGHNPDNPCDRSQFERLRNPAITILSLTFILLAPVVNFVFAIKIQLLKEKLTAFRNIIQTQYTRT